MKYILSLIFMILSLMSFGQIQPKESMKSYVDNGKIYWNKNLPIYITLSSPNTDSVSLKAPFYLDTEGVNFLRTKWEMDSTGKYTYPLKEQLWRVYADSKAPITKINLISESTYTFKGKKYYGDDLRAELIGSDALSGVDKIYYSINGSDYIIYDKKITFEVGIDIDLKFYSVDNVGNIEKIEKISYDYDNNNLNFGIDNKPPETFVISKEMMLSPKNVVELSSSDIDGVGVNSTYYSIDGGEEIKYIAPIKLNNLNEGEHIIKYFSVDWINNREHDNTFNFYLDTTAPEIIIKETIINNGLTNLRKIELNVTDNKSGVGEVSAQLKSGDGFIKYSEPFFINITHDILTIKAIDIVGNETIRIIKYSEIR